MTDGSWDVYHFVVKVKWNRRNNIDRRIQRKFSLHLQLQLLCYIPLCWCFSYSEFDTLCTCKLIADDCRVYPIYVARCLPQYSAWMNIVSHESMTWEGVNLIVCWRCIEIVDVWLFVMHCKYFAKFDTLHWMLISTSL